MKAKMGIFLKMKALKKMFFGGGFFVCDNPGKKKSGRSLIAEQRETKVLLSSARQIHPVLLFHLYF